jgi:hypothetical protein
MIDPNRFWYCHNNPVNAIDPSGLEDLDTLAKSIKLIDTRVRIEEADTFDKLDKDAKNKDLKPYTSAAKWLVKGALIPSYETLLNPKEKKDASLMKPPGEIGHPGFINFFNTGGAAKIPDEKPRKPNEKESYLEIKKNELMALEYVFVTEFDLYIPPGDAEKLHFEIRIHEDQKRGTRVGEKREAIDKHYEAGPGQAAFLFPLANPVKGGANYRLIYIDAPGAPIDPIDTTIQLQIEATFKIVVKRRHLLAFTQEEEIPINAPKHIFGVQYDPTKKEKQADFFSKLGGAAKVDAPPYTVVFPK